MKQNKFTVMSAIMAAAVLSFTACGETQEDSRKNGSQENVISAADESEKSGSSAPAEEQTGAEADASEQTVSEAPTEKPSAGQGNAASGEFKTTASIEETVLVDEDGVRITAMELNDTKNSVELKVLLENNSDKNLKFISNSGLYSCNAVNGYMVKDGYIYTDVAAGKKANETLRFDKGELLLYGIREIADLQLGFYVSDDAYQYTFFEPRQIKTSAADSYDYSTDTYQNAITSGIWETVYGCRIDYYAEDELYSQGGVRMISAALAENGDGEKALLVEIQNDTEQMVNGAVSAVTVNGLIVCDRTWTSDLVNPGARCVMELSLSSMLEEDYWEIFGISEVGNLDFTFTLKDSENEEIGQPQEIHIAVSEQNMPIDATGPELYNENGICIVSKGLAEDAFSYSDDIHMLFLIKNDSSESIIVDGIYDSLSVNGFMTGFLCYGETIPAGRYGILDVEIMGSSLEDNGISGMEEMEEMEIGIQIRNSGYKSIAEPVVTVTQ